MHYVYVIYSSSSDQLYYGETTDLSRRLKEHNRSKKQTATEQAADWRLVYYEAYQAKADAKDREEKLKNYGASRGHLKNRITDSLNNTKQADR